VQAAAHGRDRRGRALAGGENDHEDVALDRLGKVKMKIQRKTLRALSDPLPSMALDHGGRARGLLASLPFANTLRKDMGECAKFDRRIRNDVIVDSVLSEWDHATA